MTKPLLFMCSLMFENFNVFSLLYTYIYDIAAYFFTFVYVQYFLVPYDQSS